MRCLRPLPIASVGLVALALALPAASQAQSPQTRVIAGSEVGSTSYPHQFA